MTKADKHMGVEKKKHLAVPERPTPARSQLHKQKRFGLDLKYNRENWGTLSSSFLEWGNYQVWYATERGRDQAHKRYERETWSNGKLRWDVRKVERQSGA